MQEDELGDWRGQPNLVALSDDSGYFGTLSVFHSLHCTLLLLGHPAVAVALLTACTGIKRIYRYIHRDHYFHNMTDRQYQVAGEHIGASLLSLRTES